MWQQLDKPADVLGLVWAPLPREVLIRFGTLQIIQLPTASGFGPFTGRYLAGEDAARIAVSGVQVITWYAVAHDLALDRAPA
jgi:hypothetical protein